MPISGLYTDMMKIKAMIKKIKADLTFSSIWDSLVKMYPIDV